MIRTRVAPSGNVSWDQLVCFQIKVARQEYLDVQSPVRPIHCCIYSLSALVVFRVRRIDQGNMIG